MVGGLTLFVTPPTPALSKSSGRADRRERGQRAEGWGILHTVLGKNAGSGSQAGTGRQRAD